MNKSNVTKLFNTIRRNVSKRSPEILLGVGIAGMITTTVLAVKATPKALKLIEEAEYEKTTKKEGESRKLTPVETVKVAWKPYIPAIATGVLSVTCLISSGSVNAKRNAALATAYKISETALTEYKNKVVETIGEKKEQVIRENIAKDKVDQNPVSNSTVIISDKGNTLCYDAAVGRYFRSDLDKIKRAVNEINRKMTYEMYVSLNEFYDELNLPNTDLGDELGWNMDDGLVEIDYSSQIADDGTPCLVIGYSIAPRYDYCKLM